MATPVGPTHRLEITTSQIDQTDVFSRVLIPAPIQGEFEPFLRFAETLATQRKKPGVHSHRGEEVVVYVQEGTVDHLDGAGKATPLGAGWVLVVTAAKEVRHQMALGAGHSARWVSIVSDLSQPAPPKFAPVQVSRVPTPEPSADGTILRRVVGPGGAANSAGGTELDDITFVRAATAFVRVGRERRGVAYVLAGDGKVGNYSVDPGSGALLEDVSAISLHGQTGFRVLVLTAPRHGGEPA